MRAEPRQLWHFLGVQGNEMKAAITVFEHEDVAGLYDFAVTPEFQGE